MTITLAKEKLFEFHPMIAKLEHLARMKEIRVLHADFANDEVVITFTEPCSSFEEMISRIKFCEMSPRLKVIRVNFQTGEIVVEIMETDKDEELARDELQALKEHRLIEAIKLYRMRTGVGLADAKRNIEEARDRLIARGVVTAIK